MGVEYKTCLHCKLALLCTTDWMPLSLVSSFFVTVPATFDRALVFCRKQIVESCQGVICGKFVVDFFFCGVKTKVWNESMPNVV